VQGRELEAAKVQRTEVDALMHLGRYQEALDIARHARRVFDNYDERVLAAQLDTNIGNVYHRLDQYARALEYYDRARVVFADAGDRSALAMIDLNRATVLVNLNKLDLALDLYAQTRRFFQACQMPLVVAQVSYNMAYAHFLRSDYSDALQLLAEAKALHADRGDHKHVALSDLDAAEMYLQLNMFEDARALADAAARQFKRLGMDYELGKAKVFKALALFHLKDYTRVEPGLLAAKKIFVKEGNAVNAALVDVYLSDLYIKTEVPAKAIAAGRKALRVFLKHKLFVKANYTRLLLARAWLSAGKRSVARSLCKSLLASIGDHGTPWLAYQCHHLWGTLLEMENRPALAYRHYARAIDVIEALRSTIPAEEFRTHFLKDKLAVYEDMVLLCLKSGRKERLAEAFSYIERGKSRTLVDLLTASVDARLQFPNPEDRALHARWNQLRAELHGYYSQRNQQQARGDQRSVASGLTIEREIALREKALIEMQRQWQVRDREHASRPSAFAMTLADVQACLAGDEVLLEYYFARDRLWIFLVTHSDFELIPTATTKSQLRGLLRNLRFQIEKFLYDTHYVQAHLDSLRSSADWYLEQLYAALMQPAESWLRGKKLIVIPFDLLHYVPFHALRTGGRYLVEDHELSYAPSAHILQLCRTRPTPRQGRPLILGVPDERVPHISEEIRTIASLFPEALLVEGAAATRAAFIENAAGASIVHLAAHGFFQYDNPMFSALKLADAWLSFFDIYNLDLNADLVMLSGCNTGLNRVLAGDELLGLARGFLYAGAASLVVSLWAISDRATAEFMKIFYSRLKAGDAKRTALRAAQLEMKDKYQHPYFWAPFILVGRE
jgi:CHAT domain-containing protein